MNQFKDIFLGLRKPAWPRAGQQPEVHSGQRQA